MPEPACRIPYFISAVPFAAQSSMSNFMRRIFSSMSPQKRAFPTTMTVAPAAMTASTFANVIFPSTSIAQSGCTLSNFSRSSEIRYSDSGMKVCPSSPGSTVIRWITSDAFRLFFQSD